MKGKGCAYGTHRSIEPKGSLPQPAWKIDNTLDIWSNELLIDVDTLNIDAASFRQIASEAQGDEGKIADLILETVARRGKQHNPVTGSGGMLVGRVLASGNDWPHAAEPGKRIATLVSLSLTPLVIDEVLAVRPDTCQVDVKGKAVLFESGIYALLPQDMPEKMALAVLDVAGAPAQTARLASPGQTVAVIGAGGKSGLLCLYQARKNVGAGGKVLALEFSQPGVERIKETGYADEIIVVDATSPTQVLDKIYSVTNGQLADLTINCVDIAGTEMSSILSTKEGGTVYFFSMATSFTAAALGAEGVGKDVTMIIGNGYTRGHAQMALDCLREQPRLKTIFSRIYAGKEV